MTNHQDRAGAVEPRPTLEAGLAEAAVEKLLDAQRRMTVFDSVSVRTLPPRRGSRGGFALRWSLSDSMVGEFQFTQDRDGIWHLDDGHIGPDMAAEALAQWARALGVRGEWDAECT